MTPPPSPDPKKQCCERDTTVHKYSQLFFLFFPLLFFEKVHFSKVCRTACQRRRSVALLGGTVVWGDERPETGTWYGGLVDSFGDVSKTGSGAARSVWSRLSL